MSPLRAAPVTAECLIICSALFVICHARSLDPARFNHVERWAEGVDPQMERAARRARAMFSGLRFEDAQRQWGAAVVLHINSNSDEPPTPLQRQLFGTFDLWDGQWWRIPLSAFHHANLLHLLMNGAAAWFLGKRLERRWGSLWYTLFLVPAIVIPLLIEFVIGHAALGFSGAICAMLGALLVLQQLEPRDDDISDESIAFMLGLILLGIPATALEIMPIANAAHIAGVVYGWSAAWIFCGPGSRFSIARPAFLFAHLLVIPGLWLTTHPVNNGRYLWYLAERDAQSAPLRREPLLQRAIQADPGLAGIWLRLAQHRLIEGELQEAWTLLIEGLSHNPGDADLMADVRRVWRRLPYGQEREIAISELRRVFGSRADAWAKQIREPQLASAGQHSQPAKTNEPDIDPRQFPLDKPIDLDWQPDRPQPADPVPVDPDQPDSAAEGTAL